MSSPTLKTALILVDVQNDFLPGGALAIPHGDDILAPILSLLSHPFDLIVISLDWHPVGHISFASRYPGSNPFTRLRLPGGALQDLWPDHCISHTHGSQLEDSIQAKLEGREGKVVVVRKGQHRERDAYSAFGAMTDDGKSTEHVLLQNGIESVYVVGLATDYCVNATTLSAIQLGEGRWITTIMEDGMRGVEADKSQATLGDLEKAGARRLKGVEEVLQSLGSK